VALTLKAGSYFFLWYFFTVVYNVANKKLLNDIPLPITAASLQLAIGIPLFLPLWLLKPIKYDWKSISFHSKIATMHGFGNLASVISFGSGSVSFGE
jgi:solute carrier family 35 protein E1